MIKNKDNKDNTEKEDKVKKKTDDKNEGKKRHFLVVYNVMNWFYILYFTLNTSANMMSKYKIWNEGICRWICQYRITHSEIITTDAEDFTQYCSTLPSIAGKRLKNTKNQTKWFSHEEIISNPLLSKKQKIGWTRMGWADWLREEQVLPCPSPAAVLMTGIIPIWTSFQSGDIH